ncbi:helix-turn-helix domain-containing protein [Aeromonas veronii]|uniref:helix-turn-helix domain-containing protein n=1 Tax=Aeromonas veronii TaxID=654 RepID=UPI002B4A3002|nr:hypothetical protein [Aeromonas veronii]
MGITAIRNDADYEAALARIELLFDAPAGTPESDELSLLATLVEVYEEKYYPIAPPLPGDVTTNQEAPTSVLKLTKPA